MKRESDCYAVPGGHMLLVPSASGAAGDLIRVRILATDVSLAREPPSRSSILNVLPAQIVAANRFDNGSQRDGSFLGRRRHRLGRPAIPREDPDSDDVALIENHHLIGEAFNLGHVVGDVKPTSKCAFPYNDLKVSANLPCRTSATWNVRTNPATKAKSWRDPGRFS